MPPLCETWIIKVEGQVQGVGFRPFVYKLAIEKELRGQVMNRNDGVIIHVQGLEKGLELFLNELQSRAPIPSIISSIKVEKSLIEEFNHGFRIVESKNVSSSITEISPDIAVCEDCLKDLKIQAHRIDYPFINCTHCGPRFTIVRDLPYDRANTTMSPFVMCARCEKEYKDVLDRRFHAQPVACNQCGPEYRFYFQGKFYTDLQEIIVSFRRIIETGGIIAVKGVGGFHFACDANNQQAVEKLRLKKNREGKPFAVMFSGIEAAKKYVHINESEEETLSSWQRPIVLLKEKVKMAVGVSNGLDSVGVVMPYMPIHYLLFEGWHIESLVLTSGNLTDEPIVIDDDEAMERFRSIANGILTYNREIFNRVDDSVVAHFNRSARIIRRSRGYAPSSIALDFNVEGIFAAGAELVNCFCIGRENKAYLSQHIGDLQNLETYEFYRESYERYKRMFRFEPTLVAHDLHPDYLSSRFAQELNIKTIAIQHHHAHIASCMVENGLDEPVIGVGFDGTGLGDDGNIWGGEFIVCDLAQYQRAAHLEYVPMPGGDKAAKEPWRMAISYLMNAYGDSFMELGLDFLNKIDREHKELIVHSIKRNINAPLTSSVGRLFDAVSAILGLSRVASFHAEAPMRLESAIESNELGEYGFSILKDGRISFKETIVNIVSDVIHKLDTGIVAAKFHNTIISAIFNTVKRIRSETGINKIALSGGVFQNRYLSEKVELKLAQKGFEVFVQKIVPANDGGLALGQLAIAAKRRMMGTL